jgi:hypothetical protein
MNYDEMPVTYNYLANIRNEGISKKELESLKKLYSSYSEEEIDSAVDSVLRNGLPPHGKISVHPITDLSSSPKVMTLFSKKETQKSEKKNADTEASLI